jgi:hypothetical protein
MISNFRSIPFSHCCSVHKCCGWQGGGGAESGITCGFACRSYMKALSAGTERPARYNAVARCDAVDGGGIAHGEAFERNTCARAQHGRTAIGIYPEHQ